MYVCVHCVLISDTFKTKDKTKEGKKRTGKGQRKTQKDALHGCISTKRHRWQLNLFNQNNSL